MIKYNPNTPEHVAIIMDGNGRWARSHGLPRVEGHRAGTLAVRRAIKGCLENGISYLTLYSFSTENWNRSESEINSLMSLLEEVLVNYKDFLHKHQVRLHLIGDIKRLPEPLQFVLSNTMEETKEHNKLNLVLALSYGAREEITSAVRSIAEQVKNGVIETNAIDPNLVSRNLWTGEFPDPDLLIRTSGEFRISNFLLWQCAYSEIVVIPDFWPEFDEQLLGECLELYYRRERRFGKTSDQLKS